MGGLTLTIDNPSSIVFPQKVYKVTEGNLVINLVGSSGADIDFNNSTFYIGITGNFLIRMISGGESSNYETIKNASFYGSASNTEEGKGRFGLNALKAHNVHFEYLSFYDAQSMGYHLFDLAAVDNFIFNDLEVRGFGKAGLSSLDRDRLYKSNHTLFIRKQYKLIRLMKDALELMDFQIQLILFLTKRKRVCLKMQTVNPKYQLI
ncbi:hypothetical protein UC317_2076 [Lactococcus lactis subsp. lactis]|nr:hypothetical protein ML8_1008 [Lactococcus lactis subsp. lactis]KSU31680.1 hypothetical protein UC317_2076 [Lactococcus lactis subsp. lactis]